MFHPEFLRQTRLELPEWLPHGNCPDSEFDMPNFSPQQLENIRQRLNPCVRDVDDLVLSDLRIFLQRFATTDPMTILDYGAGNSPYASLFPNAVYRRADHMECVGIDYKVNDESKLPVEDNTFDLVLSTQVAEHLAHPSSYFGESFRVLKPGGRMIVTTHGVWEDHGAPFDFQRWTAEGLRRDLEMAGFSVNQMFKLTTSERFYLFLVLRWLFLEGFRRWGVIGKIWRRGCRILACILYPPFHYLADWLWGDCRLVEFGHLERHRLYCIVAAEVVKPGKSPLN